MSAVVAISRAGGEKCVAGIPLGGEPGAGVANPAAGVINLGSSRASRREAQGPREEDDPCTTTAITAVRNTFTR